jgi:hypothetical protein
MDEDHQPSILAYIVAVDRNHGHNFAKSPNAKPVIQLDLLGMETIREQRSYPTWQA